MLLKKKYQLFSALILAGLLLVGFSIKISPAQAVTLQSVPQAPTLLTITLVTSSANPSAYGQPVTLTAVVNPVLAIVTPKPTGTVTFKDGTNTLGTATLDANATATFTTSGLSTGVHVISANYNGDSSFVASISLGLTQIVGKSNTNAVLTSAPNPSNLGQAVVFTATISAASPGAGTPTGSVSFVEGLTTLGTGTLNGSGVATLSLSSLTGGSHVITAVYAGDTNFNGSVSPAVTQAVTKANTTTTLASSPNPSTLGQNVTFTATVAINSGTGTPTGTVSFYDGSLLLGVSPVLANGTATFSTPLLLQGSHSITATYNGDGSFNTSTSPAVNQTTNPNTLTATVTAITSSPNASTFGQTVTFTATVTTLSGTPTGTVIFNDGNISLGTATLSGGVASLTASQLTAGTHTVTATYNGDSTFAPSTSVLPVVQIVNKANSTTSLVSSLSPSTYGQMVTLTATVTSTVSGVKPTGSVAFQDGLINLGTVTLDANGVATLTVSNLLAVSHSLTAVYSGDNNFNISTSPGLSQLVNKAVTTVTLTSSANPSTVGALVTLTAMVTINPPGGGTPTGTITFKELGTPLGVPVVIGSDGVASLSISTLISGTHQITAEYSGDANFAASISPVLMQTVNPAGLTLTFSSLTVTPNPASPGQPITLTATITTTSGIPGGTVSFTDNGDLIGTVGLDVSGHATLVISNLDAGAHAIVAAYSGDSNFAPSTSLPVTLAINKANANVALTSAPNPSTVGQSVTFTATVTAAPPATGTPTGNVTFLDGVVPLGTQPLDNNGVAIFSTSVLISGTHSITAAYSGDTNFNLATSSALTQTVNTTCNPMIVDSSTDSTNCGSFRDAITQALNQLANQDVTIQINVSQITLTSPLPVLTNNTTHTLSLVATCTTNNGRGVPGTTIAKSGNFTGPALSLTNRTVVQGIIINGFNGNGIEINGDSNVLKCNSIGAGSANTGDGVKITGSNNSLGTSADTISGNLISGNGGAGIRVVSGTNNTAYRNWVGYAADGTTVLKNTGGALRIAAGGQLKLGPGNRFHD